MKEVRCVLLTEPTYVEDLMKKYDCFVPVTGQTLGPIEEGGIWEVRDNFLIEPMHLMRSKKAAIRARCTDGYGKMRLQRLHKFVVCGSVEPGWEGFWFYGENVTIFPQPWLMRFDADSLVVSPEAPITVLIKTRSGSISILDLCTFVGSEWWHSDHVLLPVLE